MSVLSLLIVLYRCRLCPRVMSVYYWWSVCLCLCVRESMDDVSKILKEVEEADEQLDSWHALKEKSKMRMIVILEGKRTKERKEGSRSSRRDRRESRRRRSLP